MDAIASAVDRVQRALAVELPAAPGLVVFDGFDQLDKERALSIFAGKSWEQFADWLSCSGADFGLEEWSVLAPAPRSYYLRGLLAHLAQELRKPEPDGQFTSELFYTLAEVVSRESDKLTVDLMTYLLPLAAAVIKDDSGGERFGVWQDDVIRNASRFVELAALRA